MTELRSESLLKGLCTSGVRACGGEEVERCQSASQPSGVTACRGGDVGAVPAELLYSSFHELACGNDGASELARTPCPVSPRSKSFCTLV